MGKIKKRGVIASSLIFSLLMSQGTFVSAAEVTNTSTTTVSNSLRLQDDFYSVVNRQWLNATKIDQGKMSNSAFDENENIVVAQKKQIIKELLEKEKTYPENSDEKRIINLYKNTLNMEARNKQGIEPIKKIIEEINKIKTLNDIANLNSDSEIESYLVNFGVATDLKDATKNALYVGPTSLSLGNSDEYVKQTENSVRIKGLTINYYTTILTLSGYTKEQAKVKVDNLFKFESLIAPSIKGNEEQAKNHNAIDEQYNVYTLNELDSLAPNLKLKTIMKNNKIDKANKIIVTDPNWLKGLNTIYKEDNLPIIKDYLEIINIAGASQYLGENFEKAATEFSNGVLGSQGDLPKEEKALNMVDNNSFGKIYVQKYFSAETKKDVKSMADEIIATYEKRINNLDWMSDVTKKRAIEKLNKLNIQVGYPDKWEDYSKLEIKSYENGGSLWENIQNLKKFAYEKSIKELNEPVDKSKFIMPPQTVNAYYNPTTNTVTMLAGILQGEFYNANASKEKNLGAIGTIIGHEISHAFDNNGAKFDSDGNLNSWWTEEDYKKFEEKTNKFRSFYSQVKVDNDKNVNGDLTVGENIADNGGMACALDILGKIKNPDYKVFFESNATVWREINAKEYANMRLQYDTHSPNKVRVNKNLPQFDKFYETYGIKENDKMYIKPEERLQVW